MLIARRRCDLRHVRKIQFPGPCLAALSSTLPGTAPPRWVIVGCSSLNRTRANPLRVGSAYSGYLPGVVQGAAGVPPRYCSTSAGVSIRPALAQATWIRSSKAQAPLAHRAVVRAGNEPASVWGEAEVGHRTLVPAQHDRRFSRRVGTP